MDYRIWFFYSKENYFVDEMGDVIYDVYRYVPPNIVYLFKRNKEYMLFKNENGIMIEMHYLDDDDY